MFTRCTECKTLFRVSRPQLNAARGQVRCGRCGNVFDALESLEEEVVAPELGGVGDRDALRRSHDEGSDDGDIEDRDALRRSHDEASEAGDIEDRDALRRSHGLGGRRVAFAAVVLLAVLFAAQLVHLNRHRLAADERFSGLLSATYERLGVELDVAPRTDLAAFALLHHELVAHPRTDDALHLSGVLHNAAEFAQPWPVLELRLEDRFGEVVAARRLHPHEYLRNPPDGDEPMPARARRAIEVEFIDPGHDAVGFSIDFCVELRARLQCGANEINARGT